MGSISSVKVTVLVDNTTHYEGPILAENGLSLFVEVESEDCPLKILFDTGLTGDSLIRNAKELKIDLNAIDAIVISHNHYDHTGGMLKVLEKINKQTPIIIHPDALKPKYAVLPNLGIRKLTYTGPDFQWEKVEEKGGLLVPSRKPLTIAENIIVTGEIPRVTEFEKVEGYYIVENEEFRKDFLLDDQALILKMKSGLIVITGCGHSGIINTLQFGLKVSGTRNLRAVIGGFHLIDATPEKLEKTMRKLKELSPDIIIPIHCTGFKAKKKIAELFTSSFKELYCGENFKIT